MYKFELNDPSFLPHCGCSLSLTLTEGRGRVLKGANGLGKTTLMASLYEDYLKISDEVAYIEQKSLDFFYDRSLKDIKKIIFQSRPEIIDQSFFLKCWKAFGLIEKEDRFLSSLSGGEAQSLKLCCGLSKKASLYLLDEPTQSLDQDKKHILSSLLEELIEAQRLVMVIEHDLNWLSSSWSVQELILEKNLLQVGEPWII
jgi:ABC-type Mn2+/Zn2+ transport system ATPase subunit